MVELDDAVGDHHRVVVGQRDDPGAESDVPGALGGEGDEDLGRRNDLVAGRVVLSDPGLLEAKLVEPHHQVEVALETGGRVLLVGMEGRQEDPVPKGDLAHRALAFAAATMLSGSSRGENLWRCMPGRMTGAHTPAASQNKRPVGFSC